MLRLNIRFLNPSLVTQVEEVESCEGNLDTRAPVEDVGCEACGSPGEGAGRAGSRTPPENHPCGAEDRDVAAIEKTLLRLLLQAERSLFEHCRVVSGRGRCKVSSGERRENLRCIDVHFGLRDLKILGQGGLH